MALMSKKTAISFDNVTKTYPSYHHVTGGIKSFLFNIGKSVSELRRRTLVLDDISLEIGKGESFGFIGRNGAGKSTSLGLIAGVLAPDTGKVVVNGRVSPLLELGAGFHPELTGRENILLNGILMGLCKDQVLSQMDAIVEFSELGNFIEQPVRTYSSGMYAKLGFSVVANLSPEILLVDEILSVGDLAFSEKCVDKFTQFNADPDVTIVLVSHSLDAVKQVCERVAWVDGHRLKMVGNANDVVEAYIESISPKAKIFVPNHIARLPPYVITRAPFIDYEKNGAQVPIELTHAPQNTSIVVSLLLAETKTSIQEWAVSGDLNTRLSLLLSDSNGSLCLDVSEGGGDVSITPKAIDDSGAVYEGLNLQHEKRPLVLGLHTEGPDWDARAQRTFCPVFPSQASRFEWERWRGQLLLGYGQSSQPRAPLWPEGSTVRIVARNIFLRDAVGHFALGVCGLLSQSGVPARVYAYVSSPELAGIVRPITALKNDVRPEDIVFYNFSIEDEFLDVVTELSCRRVLYYHNVTPSEWFRPYIPDFADVLDRSREQFIEFSNFDAALANSEFSLDEIKPFLRDEVFSRPCPPTLNPDRLLSAKIQAPPELSGRVVLWVGRMVPHKQPDVALKIFAEMFTQCSDLSLVMVGSGLNDMPAYSEAFHQVFDSLSPEAQQRVMMLEGIEDSALRALYLRADVFLCTSAHEGFCVPLYEAMSFGLPISALQQPAVVETLNGAGYILSESISDAANQLAALMDDQLALDALEIKAKKRGQELRESATGEQIWQALNEVLRLGEIHNAYQ